MFPVDPQPAFAAELFLPESRRTGYDMKTHGKAPRRTVGVLSCAAGQVNNRYPATRMSIANRKLDYSTISILIGILSLAWFLAPRPFDPYKHHSVGTVIAIVAICFAAAGFRLGSRRRAVIGLSIGLFSFCGYLLIVPL